MFVSLPWLIHRPVFTASLGNFSRYGYNGRLGGFCIGNENGKELNNKRAVKIPKNERLNVSPQAATSDHGQTPNSSTVEFYQEILRDAREKFKREISFELKDTDILLAKALLYVGAEDESLIAFNREKDALYLQTERRASAKSPSDARPAWSNVEAMPLAGKTMDDWLRELDDIANEVESVLVSRKIGRGSVEVMDAVNTVFFNLKGFRRSNVLSDSTCSYLHSALCSGFCSAIMLSVIYIEVCQRLNLKIVGSRVGEGFIIWPQTANPEELFKTTAGHSLFGILNGKCVEDPQSKASDITNHSLSGLEIATNRDIIGIALANLIRLHWKRASKAYHGLMLTSPLEFMYNAEKRKRKSDAPNFPVLRPQELRLAMMASERLMILQPHNWSLRRDHAMMLYYTRDYDAAIRELSICMIFAPEEQVEVLMPFIQKLHLLEAESSWNSLGHKWLTIP
ncbi:unnamed protein product [Cuscuta epithymum]|uniref:Protein SirB1 N-terminal domain-containing protein n=1 Tax=Cuscuta epithymum TaxID=186058 RepID=A0AAV0FRL2_9ASTE|nr:unnamed protein product [Cuscuta epithymum]